jgi:DNA-binding NarL/FixJ family response regulator
MELAFQDTRGTRHSCQVVQETREESTNRKGFGVNWHDPFNKCRAEFNSFKGDKWPLMPRQQLILHLCNIGLQRKDIAGVMGVTVSTLQKHIDRVYKKLGVHTREDAIKKGIMK